MATDNADVVVHEDVTDAIEAFVAEVLFVKNDAINPHFKNKYASLKGVITQIKKPLAKHGLSYRQKVTNLNGQVALKTIIRHKASNTEDSAIAPISHKPNDPQSVGSGITYYRRYMLLTQLGLLTDDDDDGNLAAGREESKTPQQQSQDFWAQKSNLTKALTKKGMTIDDQKALVQKVLNKPKIETVEEVYTVAKEAGLAS